MRRAPRAVGARNALAPLVQRSSSRFSSLCGDARVLLRASSEPPSSRLQPSWPPIFSPAFSLRLWPFSSYVLLSSGLPSPPGGLNGRYVTGLGAAAGGGGGGGGGGAGFGCAGFGAGFRGAGGVGAGFFGGDFFFAGAFFFAFFAGLRFGP